MNKRIKIFSPNASDLSLVYRVKVLDEAKYYSIPKEPNAVVADIFLIGEEHQDIFSEALKEIQKFMPTHSLEEIETLVENCDAETNSFSFGKYEFIVICDCDCIEYNKL